MSLPVRKPTRMSWYDYSSAGIYFITICAKEKQKLFGRIVGDGDLDVPHMELSETGKIIDRYILGIGQIPALRLEKYVIMPNHIHLLLSVTEKETATVTERQNMVIPHAISTFKRFCNREIGENVFQRSYHDHVVRDERHFEIIWNYMEDNPRRWKEDCFYL